MDAPRTSPFRRAVAGGTGARRGGPEDGDLPGEDIAMAYRLEKKIATQFALAAEFATRNMAVATAVAVSLVGRVEFATFATTYLLVETPILLAVVQFFRARAIRRDQSSAEP